jgi:hypothetical protein
MERKLDRRNDECLYQPKIHSDRIKALYLLKRVTGKPMTVLLDLAIREFTERYTEPIPLEPESGGESTGQQTGEEIREYRSLLDRLDYEQDLGELDKIKSNEQRRNTSK